MCSTAATIEDCSIEHDHGRYHIDFHATLNASATASYAVISEVSNFPLIDSTVRQVRVISQSEQLTRLEVEAHLCVLGYCRNIHDFQDMMFVRYIDGGDVVTTVLPQFSDFRYGRTEWRLRADGALTRLHVVAELEPAFEAPPVIGPWLIKHVLRSEAERTAQGIERLAQR